MKDRYIQKTLKEKFEISGVALHTGEYSTIEVCPADVDFGYQFQRVDIQTDNYVDASYENVVDTERSTTIGNGHVKVQTIEHLMAALYAMGIDNALIKINKQELPILDGSAALYVQKIKEVGVVEQDKESTYFVFDKPISMEVEGGCYILLPKETYQLDVTIDYSHTMLGIDKAVLSDISVFEREISDSRTFCFYKELELLAEKGLIKGGNLDNALVFLNDSNVDSAKLDVLAKKMGKKSLDVSHTGKILNTTNLRSSNEPARHKLLDVIGDMALLQRRIQGKLVITRPGHKNNIAFCKAIIEHLNKKYFDTTNTVLDVEKIKRILPHRYPFLMVDRVLDITDETIVGMKTVTANESVFLGHFPTQSVFPGVLQIEFIAQTGGIFVLHDVEDPENYTTYLLRVDGFRFKKMVVPGDVMICELMLNVPVRRGFVNMTGISYVNGEEVCRGTMLARVSKN